MGSVNRDDDADLLHRLRRLHLDDPASRQTTVSLHPRTPSPPRTADGDPALEEALRRSRCETTLEESLLADALAASIATRDEELALALQREQLALHEQELRRVPQRNASSSPASASASASTSASTPAPASAPAPASTSTSASASARTSTPAVDPAPAKPIPRRPPIIRVSRRRSAGPSAGSSAPPAGPAIVSLPPPLGQLSAAEPVSSQNRPANQPTGPGANTSKHPFGTSRTSALSPVTPSPGGSNQSGDRCISRVAPVKQPFTFGAGSSYSEKDGALKAGTKPASSLRDDGQKRAPAGAPAATTVADDDVDADREAPSVVVDGQNVGCSIDLNGRFRSRGVQAVLDYYGRQGVRAVALLPRAKVDERGGVYADRVADDPGLLLKLAKGGRVAFTPAGSHDDHFLLQYAMSRGLDLISNDRFQKEIAMQETSERAQALRSFLRRHLIPYTFVQNEFIPHPNPARLGDVDHASRKR